MLLRSMLAILIVFCATIVHGQETIQWKLKEGQTFYVDMVLERKLTTTVFGNENTENSTHRVVQSCQVAKILENGHVQLKQKFELFKMIEDGVEESTISPLMVGSEFLITYSASMEPQHLEGYEKFLERISQGDEEVEQVIKTVLTESVVTQLTSQGFGNVPDKPVKKGDQWKRIAKASIGPLGEFQIHRTYTYAGPASVDGTSYDQFDAEGRVEFQPAKEENETLGFTITDGKLEAEKLTGTVLFDRQAGRMHESTAHVHLTGELTVAVEAQELDIELESVEKVVIRFDDKMPELEQADQDL